MKKFCSACGNQLELSQRFCIKCGAVNPFFVSAFTFLSDQSDDLEKLREEKERIDKELAEKEEKQAEFMKQEQLRREAEESEKLKLERLEKERVKKEQLELERMESNLKEELLRVKEETIQHQKETIDLVKGVREELIQMEAGNKRLKEEVANLSKDRFSDREYTEPAIAPKQKSKNEKGIIVSLLVILLGLTSVLTFFYFTNRQATSASELSSSSQQEVLLQSAETVPEVIDTVVFNDSVAVKTDTVEIKPARATPVIVEPKKETVASPPTPKSEFVLTESKVTRDLIGKKISGCDIIIEGPSEIEVVSNLTLVEKMPSGSLKYKFTLVIVQGSDSFTAVPYIYYSAAGGFLKVDGTNCE
ncbi:MAG: zinc-ribbon domain-containing protein [Bacteroidota bacterium]